MRERMSFWVALGTVVVCGIATGVVMHAVGVMFVANTVTARGQALVSTARPEDATSALVAYVLLAAVVEALLVKLAVAALTSFRITFLRALSAGLVSAVLGLLPVAAVLARPAHAHAGTLTGIDAGMWMLALPLSLAVIALHALLVAGLAEPRGSGASFGAYTRAMGRS
jgi:hypothetical protein